MTLCFSDRKALLDQLTDYWTQKLVQKHQSRSKSLCFSDRRALLHQLTDYWTENYCGRTDGGL